MKTDQLFIDKASGEKAYKGLKLNKKQKQFLIALDAVALNISSVCKKMNISRSFYEHWERTNDDFKMAVSHIEESRIDFAESALMTNIRNLDTRAITYFLDNKAKHRGYGQKIDINQTNVNKHAELSHYSDEELNNLRLQLQEKDGTKKAPVKKAAKKSKKK